jgi:hypothetical protein
MIGQDDTLKGTTASVDVATKENLDNLVVIEQLLLKKDESRLNWETGQLETIEKGRTNEITLKRYGKTPKCMLLSYIIIVCHQTLTFIAVLIIDRTPPIPYRLAEQLSQEKKDREKR